MSKEDVLRRVRALLAKAESSKFAEESEAYAAKAEELIARHAIELHLVHAEAGTREKPETRTIKLERPFTRPKGVLLHQIARHYRVISIMMHERGTSFPNECVLAGFPSDLDAVELLWTSLMLQQAHAAARETFIGNAAQVMSQRTSFLYGYSARINARLAAIHKKVASEPGTGLVLRDRADEVRDYAASLLAGTKKTKSQIKHARAFHAGGDAADRADLNQDRLGRTRTEIGV